jgi:hypothetical protein
VTGKAKLGRWVVAEDPANPPAELLLAAVLL